jgi:hypothetical protein
VPALEFRDPVVLFVEMESRDAALGRHARDHIRIVNRMPATNSGPKICLL